jgi:exodeoxyribonuclease-3
VRRFSDDFTHYLDKQRRKRRERAHAARHVAHQKARCKELARLSAITRLLAPERAWLDEVTGTMAADALREVSREGDQFSWWSDSEQAEHQPSAIKPLPTKFRHAPQHPQRAPAASATLRNTHR